MALSAKELLPLAATLLPGALKAHGGAVQELVYVLVNAMLPPGDEIARLMLVNNDRLSDEDADVEVRARIAKAAAQDDVFTLGAVLAPESLLTLLENLAENPDAIAPVAEWLELPVPDERCRVLVISGGDLHAAHVLVEVGVLN